MKKISLLITVITLSASVFISCKNDASKKTENPVGKMDEEHKGSPPHGDKKGRPPGVKKGGHGPEQTKTLEEIGGYKLGEIATDFSLKNIDKKIVSLAGIENAKGYIVTFTCNECPFAKMYEDRLITLHNTYAPKGYPVIAINSNNPSNEKEAFEAMQSRAKEKGFTFPYLVDGEKIYAKYGAVRTPHVFLLDKNRTVQYIGAIDDNAKSSEDVKVKYIENAIEALEKGEKPNPNLTKAIGCPIKA